MKFCTFKEQYPTMFLITSKADNTTQKLGKVITTVTKQK